MVALSRHRSRSLGKWNRVKAALLEGREPPPLHDPRPKIADVVNHYLTFKRWLVVSGEITARTRSEHYATCKLLVDCFGRAM
jgi:hypothetical protein